MIWGTIIAWYLFLAGLGAGAYIFSCLIEKLYPQHLKMRKIARYIAPLAVMVGLVLLIFDAKAGLFHPWRFLLLIANLHSVMSWGVIFLALFIVIALLIALAEFKSWVLPRWLIVLQLVLAVSVATYTGVLLGVVRTFPLWNNPLLPLLFLVSALSAGAAITIGLTALKAPDEALNLHRLSAMHLALPVVEVVFIVVLLFMTAYDSQSAALQTVKLLVAGKYALIFWAGLIILGLVVPFALELYSHKHEGQQESLKTLTILAQICVLIGGFTLRYLVVVSALPVHIVS